jgi:hypothetical protein
MREGKAAKAGGAVKRERPREWRRLKQAGVRLAAYLNDIYAEPQTLPPRPQP